MKTIILYCYNTDEATVVSPNQPEVEYIERYRLVADENKVLTKDGKNLYTIIDIDKEDLASWREADRPEDYGVSKASETVEPTE